MGTPTEAELKLLRVLWAHDRLSARELHTLSEAATGWSFSTTRKTLDRMTDKGLVSVDPVHGVRTFTASEPRLKTMAGLIQNFARNVLGTDGSIPAATFVQSGTIASEEVDELERYLDELDGAKKR